MITKDNLDSLIDKVRLQVIEYTGLNPLIKLENRGAYGLSVRNIFLRVVDHFFGIAEHEYTGYIAQLLNIDRSTVSINLKAIKTDYKQSTHDKLIANNIIQNIEFEISKEVISCKELLEKHKLYLEQELLKVNELISKL